MNSPLVPAVQVLRGGDVLAHADALRSVYIDAFCAPPWNEDEEKAAEFAERLRHDARRPGFTTALAVAGRDVLGFASGWTTLPPFPTDRCRSDDQGRDQPRGRGSAVGSEGPIDAVTEQSGHGGPRRAPDEARTDHPSAPLITYQSDGLTSEPPG